MSRIFVITSETKTQTITHLFEFYKSTIMSLDSNCVVINFVESLDTLSELKQFTNKLEPDAKIFYILFRLTPFPETIGDEINFILKSSRIDRVIVDCYNILHDPSLISGFLINRTFDLLSENKKTQILKDSNTISTFNPERISAIRFLFPEIKTINTLKCINLDRPKSYGESPEWNTLKQKWEQESNENQISLLGSEQKPRSGSWIPSTLKENNPFPILST
jgi:hypothetical protein